MTRIAMALHLVTQVKTQSFVCMSSSLGDTKLCVYLLHNTQSFVCIDHRNAFSLGVWTQSFVSISCVYLLHNIEWTKELCVYSLHAYKGA